MKWVVRTKTVRVATDDGERLYRSVDDIPEALRDRMKIAIEGSNSQTILIANQEAYRRISNDSSQLPPEIQRLRPALMGERPARVNRARRPPRGSDREWKIALVGGLAAIVGLWALWLWAIQTGTS